MFNQDTAHFNINQNLLDFSLAELSPNLHLFHFFSFSLSLVWKYCLELFDTCSMFSQLQGICLTRPDLEFF